MHYCAHNNPRERVKLPTGGKGAQRQAHESL